MKTFIHFKAIDFKILEMESLETQQLGLLPSEGKKIKNEVNFCHLFSKIH